MKAIIMCGGSGTRLWPLSTHDKPKQFLHLVDESRTMFEMTCDLAVQAGATELIIVCNERLAPIVHEQFIANTLFRVVREPVSRNTAPAIAAGIYDITDDEEVVLVMPSDHAWDSTTFCEAIDRAQTIATAHPTIVTIGIEPTYPETGYGYIEHKSDGEVVAFREKPDLPTASSYLTTGRHLWNSGIFVFRKGTMESELRRLVPDILQGVSDARVSAGTLSPEIFARIRDISIDYAVMEHCRSAHVVPYRGKWTDIGSFRSLHDVSEKDEDGNALRGSVRQLQCKDSLVIAHQLSWSSRSTGRMY